MSLHVVPTDDLIDHTLTKDCPCEVRVEPVERDDGTLGLLHIHRRLDAGEQIDVTVSDNDPGA